MSVVAEHVAASQLELYLLVNDDKALLAVGTDLVLQGDDLPHAVLDELPLCRHQLLPLLGALVEEAGVDLRLLVLQGDVAGQDEGVLHPLLHVGVPGAVVQHQTSDQSGREEKGSNTLRSGTQVTRREKMNHLRLQDEDSLCVAVGLMLHFHDFHHVQVDGLIGFRDGQHSIHNSLHTPTQTPC